MALSMTDQVVLVDDNDIEIGIMDKVEAHRGAGKLHRAISVFLFNSRGELLLQQRSSQKITCQLKWANTCCGNVRPTESYLECANRRLFEELGISGVNLVPVTKFQYQVSCDDRFSEAEIDQVFTGIYDGDIVPNSLEVASVMWVNPHHIFSAWSDEENWETSTYVPWAQFFMAQPQIAALLRHPL